MNILDVVTQIMIKIDIEDMISFSSVNKFNYQIYRSESFWLLKCTIFPFYTKRTIGIIWLLEYVYCNHCLFKANDIIYKFTSNDLTNKINTFGIKLNSIAEINHLNLDDLYINKCMIYHLIKRQINPKTNISYNLLISYKNNRYILSINECKIGVEHNKNFDISINQVRSLIYGCYYYNYSSGLF